MKFTFTVRELGNLLLSSLILGFLFSMRNLNNFVFMTLIIGLSFIVHELSHKFVAEFFDCRAEYVIWPKGILFSLIIGFLSGGSVIFAAIGFVSISSFYATRLGFHYSHLSLEESGKISIAGPLSNVVLGIIFGFLAPSNPSLWIGVSLNFSLALFNLLPFPPLDGSKVFMWSRIAWGSMIISSGVIFGLTYLINPLIAGLIGLTIMLIMIGYLYYKSY